MICSYCGYTVTDTPTGGYIIRRGAEMLFRTDDFDEAITMLLTAGQAAAQESKNAK